MDSDYYQPPPQRADLWTKSLQNNSIPININLDQRDLIAQTEARYKSVIPSKFHSDWSIYAGNISNIESVALRQKDYISGASKM